MNPLLNVAKYFSLAGVALVLGGCASVKLTHIPPGESMNAAMAKKAELVRMPVAQTPAPALPGLPGHVPAVEPELPGNSTVERVAEAYSRGEFCLGAGKDDEAIAAFEEAVKIDPAFTEAWQQLAMLYEKKGSSKKAIEAFRRSKKIASH
jgi:tetratricopeptide (TPR) repeat protein